MLKENYLSTIEAAEKLGLHYSHVIRLCKAGQLPEAEKMGRNWLIPRSSVEAYQSVDKSAIAKQRWEKRKSSEGGITPTLKAEIKAAVAAAKEQKK